MRNFLFILLCFLATSLTGQDGDPVLFTVGDQEVAVSEFDYIYNKNNREGADYSESSLREYLDLYTKFKLKVQRARDMQLDTISQLQKELAGYRKQLANAYLNDREVKDRLVREAYDRMQQDVHIAHILVRVPQRAAPKDTLAAFDLINSARKMIGQGQPFAEAAMKYSQDESSKANGGDIGFITAIMPSGFYSVETAAYETPVGQVSGIVRSPLGYHLIKVIEKRPARGRIDASHILVRVNENQSNASAARNKIDQLNQQIRDGASFEELARKHSDDEATARRGGYIGTFGINTYDAAFEDAAFALEKEGDISEPVRSRLGYHIIKLLRKRPLEPFDEARRKIEGQISRDERIEVARSSLISRIKDEGGFKLDQAVYRNFVSSVDGDLFNYRWTPPTLKEETLFSFGSDMVATNTEFGRFMRVNARNRMRLPKNTPREDVVSTLFDDFVQEKALEYEEQKLAEKYPDFKALMREYEEGILLFEATKINVWDKAAQDTAGLEAFYEVHRNDYMWGERANLVTYTLPAGNEKLLDKVMKLASRHTPEKVVAKANGKETLVSYVQKKVEQGSEALGELPWEKGAATAPVVDEENGRVSFTVIESITPPAPKKLTEARGYIIADYQDQLEKEWVSSLEDAYTVNVNEDVFKKLIRK